MTTKAYNVHCIACGAVYQPQPRSSLWWKAKKRDDQGFLDALPVDGETCGCVKKPEEPDAPYRVFGFDDMCRDFDIPFTAAVPAMKSFLNINRSGGYTVFISGVSDAVHQRLTCM